MDSRVIIIGDIHGCVDEFRALLRELDYKRGQDKLYLTGDLIDRGPEPLRTVLLAREAGAFLVQGNHERKHLSYRHKQLAGEELPPSSYWWLKTHNQLTEEAWAYLEKAPTHLYIDKDWLLIHGDKDPRVLLGRISQEESEWRGHWVREWEGPEKVVFGHMILGLGETISIPERGLYGVDSGCCFGGGLTALVLPELRKVTVGSEKYSERFNEKRNYKLRKLLE